MRVHAELAIMISHNLEHAHKSTYRPAVFNTIRDGLQPDPTADHVGDHAMVRLSAVLIAPWGPCQVRTSTADTCKSEHYGWV